MKTKVIYKVVELISDNWNKKGSWITIGPEARYFNKYSDAENFRNKEEDEYTKYAIEKIFITEYE